MKSAPRTLRITYKMLRGEDEVAEAIVTLPISNERYEKLSAGLAEESREWQSIREALINLVYLQGYDRLGGWGLELTIEA